MKKTTKQRFAKHVKGRDFIIWNSNKKPIKITDMTLYHLQNAIIICRFYDNSWGSYWASILHTEINFRKEVLKSFRRIAYLMGERNKQTFKNNDLDRASIVTMMHYIDCYRHKVIPHNTITAKQIDAAIAKIIKDKYTINKHLDLAY